mgnify:CR=1 FL=1
MRSITGVAVSVVAFLGFMTYKGATTPEGVSLGAQIPVTVPAGDAEAIAGKGLVETGGCLNCHMVKGIGGAVGPDLTNEASKGRGIEWQVDHLRDPKSRVPGSAMPAQAGLSDEQANQIATFLEGLGTTYK